MMHVHIPCNQSERGILYHGVQIHQSEARISPMYQKYKALWGLIVAYDVTIRRSQSQVKANERNWSRRGKAE